MIKVTRHNHYDRTEEEATMLLHRYIIEIDAFVYEGVSGGRTLQVSIPFKVVQELSRKLDELPTLRHFGPFHT